jgi:hypothetical protein
MKRKPIPSDILKLDGGNASAIGKRVGRTANTIKRWMRDGIPAAARDKCRAAVERRNRAVKASAARKAKVAPSPIAKRPKTAPKRPAQKVAISRREAREAQERLTEKRREAARRGVATRKANREKREWIAEVEKDKVWFEKAEKFDVHTEASIRKAKERYAIDVALRIEADAKLPPLTQAEKAARYDRNEALEILNRYRLNPDPVKGSNGIAPLEGEILEDRKVLRDYIANDDKYWMRIVALAKECGLSIDDARSSWFSPKVR